VNGCTAAAVILSFWLLGFAGCGDEPQGPLADHVIRINESNFNPSYIRDAKVGQKVEWQNWHNAPRTVISGSGPLDPNRGLKFSQALAGRPSGQAIGGRFRIHLTEPDTIRYYNDVLPPGFVGSFGGTIVVVP
jgi:hypothetical protein